jgi:hypothetical protein
MSKEELHEVAQRDTPPYVDLPKSWPGILAWITVKLGPWAVISVVCGWATSVVYTHQREDQHQLLNAYQANIRAMDAFTAHLRNMQDAIDDAHRRAIDEKNQNPK